MAATAAEKVRGLMPQLQSDLADLVAIPSVSAPGFPEETRRPLVEAYEAILGLFRDAGVGRLEALELPDSAPVITGTLPAPDDAPTVLLYGHYDVVPPGDESLWDSPPFEPEERDGSIYGRGTADSKSNLLVHVGALRAWEGKPPVGIKLLIEGQEEVGSPLEDPARLGRFTADALLIADGGNIRPGEPSLGVAIRGDASVTVEARTLASGKHSGQYGGAAPDALLALLRALASLHDENGDVAVEGLRREPWTGVTDTEEEFRELAEVQPGVPSAGHWRARRAALHRPGHHRYGHRRPLGGRCGQRRLGPRPCKAERPRPSRAGRRRGAGRGDPAPGRYPRAALGVSTDFLVAVACDGRRSNVDGGLSMLELAEVMVELGAESAINLDGGGSTTLVHRGHLLNRPYSTQDQPAPASRRVVTALAFEPR